MTTTLQLIGNPEMLTHILFLPSFLWSGQTWSGCFPHWLSRPIEKTTGNAVPGEDPLHVIILEAKNDPYSSECNLCYRVNLGLEWGLNLMHWHKYCVHNCKDCCSLLILPCSSYVIYYIIHYSNVRTHLGYIRVWAYFLIFVNGGGPCCHPFSLTMWQVFPWVSRSRDDLT